MIIIKLSGGLGNQLYQYALFKKFVSLGVEAKMSLAYFNTENAKSGPKHSARYLLSDIFCGIHESFTNEKEEKKYLLMEKNLIIKRMATMGLIPGYIVENSKYEKTTYHPRILKYRNAFIDGYWQSELYSKDIMLDLKKDLMFKKPLNGKNELIAQQIKESNSVSIHVRHGDYLKHSDEYEVLSINYYINAISEIKKKVNNPSFFVFSDDISWCKNNLPVEATYVDWNTNEDSYIDMQLMSLCKHNIVANSTFSIWAALLNLNDEKIVCHPSRYSKDIIQKQDRWPVDWIEIID